MPTAKKIVVFGVEHRSFTAACAAYGHAHAKVNHRIKAGMTLEQALLAPNIQHVKKHPNYGNWNAMRSRCYSKGNAGYSRYGAKGITMCDRWKDDFWAFVADMGLRPSKNHTVDRIDNSKGYFKENCRWATMEEQCANKHNPSGTDHAFAKLTGRDVLAIRKLKGKTTLKALADAFETTESAIHNIQHFKTYRSIGPQKDIT